MTLAGFFTHLIFPLTTAAITTSFLTRTCSYKYFSHITKKLAWNKDAIEELSTKVNWLEFWFVGIKNIEANVYEAISSQQVSFNC